MKPIFVLSFFCFLFWFCGQSNSQGDDEFLYDTFPEGFLWGLSTSAYQSEGAWNIDGKGMNIWDTWTKINDGENIADGSNGDVACDSYHKYLEDIRILKEMGANSYRLSISWSRILPNVNGTSSGHEVNQLGVDFYNRFFDAMLENGITPLVTMYHWDLPQGLQDIGGWPNEILAEEFAAYATVLFTEFGDRVKHWITINEPWNSCQNAYGDGAIAPGIKEPAELPYQCGHTIIKAHALAYRIYETQFKPTQQGQVGLSFSADWTEPKNPSNPDDVEAALRSRLFTLGWFAHPLFKGDYPPIMRQLIDEKSQQEGRNSSRLPTFTPLRKS